MPRDGVDDSCRRHDRLHAGQCLAGDVLEVRVVKEDTGAQIFCSARRVIVPGVRPSRVLKGSLLSARTVIALFRPEADVKFRFCADLRA